LYLSKGFILKKFPRLIAISPPKEDENGQGLAEYALILSLVAVVCVLSLAALGGGIGKTFTRVTCAVNSKAPGCSCINEQITVTGSCIGTTLVANIKTSCAGSQMDITGYGGVPASGNISWSSAPICTGGATTMQLYSLHPDGSYASYNARP
jgi:pilus assembly protein Flp/PilA